MSRKIKLIYNPASRGGKSRKYLPKIQSYLDEQGADYNLVETTAPLDGIEKSKSALEEGYNVVCAIGGDGTSHEVGNGAIQSNLTFSVIPVGSGNDFAAGLGIENTWKSGVETLLNGKKERISISNAGSRYSINIVDAGFGGDVAKASEKHLKWITGSKKYTLLTLALLTRHKPYKVDINIDGEEFEYDLNIFAAGFGQSFGSGMNILPDGRYNKEKMQIAVVHSASRFKILRVFPKVFDGSHVTITDNVDMFEGKKVTVTPKESQTKPLRSEADGELFLEGQLTLEAIPQGLEVIIPKDWSFDNLSRKVKQ
ncbi:MAG: diacylglycerol/lipid kinase family protein [Candidatus Kariarchaeaceae archaeon]|jgi:YegS/Rv2252/BmrU family lipid kinase